jgi:preprotein translocase subunit SecB
MEEFQFKLIDYKLIKMHFSLTQSIKGNGTDILVNPEFKMNHSNFTDGCFDVFLEIKIENRELPFSINCAIEGVFQLNRAPENESELDKIAMINCNAVLFPFLRETVADFTRRAGLTPLLLPSVNFTKFFSEKLDKK